MSTWGHLLLPQCFEHLNVHNPLSWLIFRCFSSDYLCLVTLFNTFDQSFLSDLTTEYSNTSHTISLTTPGMEIMMEEYIAYKAGNRRDPVDFLNGAKNALFRNLI